VSASWSRYAPRLLVVLALACCAALLTSSLARAAANRALVPRVESAKRVGHSCQRHHRRRHHRHHRRQRCAHSVRRARAGSGSNTSSNPRDTVPTPISPDFYGVNGQMLSPKFMPTSQWGIHLRGIHDAGFTSVRREAWWCDVERRAPTGGGHNYDWTELDQFVGALAQYHLRWYATISPGASWAGSSWAAPPDDAHIPDYAAFAGALAQRYGSNGTFWQAHPELPYEPVRDFEIWNEPDNQTFWVDDMSDSPARYGRMVAAASAAIHDADPQARAVAGALAPTGATDYLASMVRDNPGLRGQVSTVSFHPYGHTATRSLDRIVAMRHTIDQWLGRDVSMEISEDGFPIRPGAPADAVDDRAALWRTEALTLPRTDCNIEEFLPHSWTEPKADPTNPNEWYGMADWNTAELDPSGLALKSAVRRMEGLGSEPPPATKLHLCYGG
jgi:hypothetical protein